MTDKQKNKTSFHPRSKHRERYDFEVLIRTNPALATFVHTNKYGNASIDFFQPEAVKELNKSLLMHHYDIQYWELPDGYLCPPIPSRADYMHHIADILGKTYGGTIPKGQQITCLDIGVGANCIYPLLGHQLYGWSFIGTDIDKIALQAAQTIIDENKLQDAIELRWQSQSNTIFEGILSSNERVELVICNPPFHASKVEANTHSQRKLRNLKADAKSKKVLNFGGQSNELWSVGGEVGFVQRMIRESAKFPKASLWFSCLVSKQASLRSIYAQLQLFKACRVETIPMQQGNKMSRIVAWTFLERLK